ncbi:MAG: hypothetical protein ACR2NH_01495 [Solirubrobacteraceae bacterium]
MLLVTLICSDPACAEEEEVWVSSLDELLHAACACACTWEVLSVSEGQEARLRLSVVTGERASGAAAPERHAA